jgi:hypothetical protein
MKSCIVLDETRLNKERAGNRFIYTYGYNGTLPGIPAFLFGKDREAVRQMWFSSSLVIEIALAGQDFLALLV